MKLYAALCAELIVLSGTATKAALCAELIFHTASKSLEVGQAQLQGTNCVLATYIICYGSMGAVFFHEKCTSRRLVSSWKKKNQQFVCLKGTFHKSR